MNRPPSDLGPDELTPVRVPNPTPKPFRTPIAELPDAVKWALLAPRLALLEVIAAHAKAVVDATEPAVISFNIERLRGVLAGLE